MKKLMIGFTLVFFALIMRFAWADPHLVCDPQASKSVTHYVVDLDGTSEMVPAETVNATHVRLYYDLEGLSGGEHTATVKARHDLWNLESDPESLSFNKPERIPACGGLGIE